VLETGRLRRVGGSGEVAVDVRVVAMTLRDLRGEARRRAFRTDLYHRLAGFEVTLPPLRRRPGDIVPLAQHFLGELAREVGPRTIDDGALALLQLHDWPGNVRELRNVLRRAAVLATSGTIDATAIEIEPETAAFEPRFATHAADREEAPVAPPPPRPTPSMLSLAGKTYDQLEREIIAWALGANGGSRRQAARALGISRSTFCDRVNRLGLGRAAGPAPGSLQSAAPATAAPAR
jgi:two-component system nitrogen regulation response regulator GlnG